MSIFNKKNYYSQRDNINESSNRIVKSWNFVVDFTNLFSMEEGTNISNKNDVFMYNVKSVELPKYSMKLHKRFLGGSERSFPIKRTCDGTSNITFYGRYNIIYVLSRMCQNFVGSEEVTNGIQKMMTKSEIANAEMVLKNMNFKNSSIEIIQLPDTLRDDNGGVIRYKLMKPILTGVEYSELNSSTNGIFEVICGFSYDDFRITTDTLNSKDRIDIKWTTEIHYPLPGTTGNVTAGEGVIG